MVIRRICPMCDSVNEITVDDKLGAIIAKWQRGDCYIQDIPLPASEREFIKTGYCMDCQKLLFGW